MGNNHPENNRSDIRLEGFLEKERDLSKLKKSKSESNWSKKYFILDEDKFAY